MYPLQIWLDDETVRAVVGFVPVIVAVALPVILPAIMGRMMKRQGVPSAERDIHLGAKVIEFVVGCFQDRDPQ